MNLLKALVHGGYHLTYRASYEYDSLIIAGYTIILNVAMLIWLRRSVLLLGGYFTLGKFRQWIGLSYMVSYVVTSLIMNPLTLFWTSGGHIGLNGFIVPLLVQTGFAITIFVLGLREWVIPVSKVCVWSICVNSAYIIQLPCMFEELSGDWAAPLGSVACLPIVFAFFTTFWNGSTDTSLSEFFKRPMGWKSTPSIILFLCLGTILTTSFLSGVCIAPFNEEAEIWQIRFSQGLYWSTRFMRSFSRSPCYGESGAPIQPCHVYLTAGRDLTSEVFVNVHLPLTAAGVGIEIHIETEEDTGSHNIKKVDAELFAFPLLDPRDQRLVYSAHLKELSPSTSYRFRIMHREYIGESYYYYRTPSRDSMVVSVGGDAGVTKITKSIFARMTTLGSSSLGIIGGDVAYDNGMYACACTWDSILDMWESNRSEDRYLVPLLMAVGNHDLGVNDNTNDAYGLMREGESCDMNWVDRAPPLIMGWFPHDQNLEPVCRRKTAHVHTIPGLVNWWILDSAYGVPALDMVGFVTDSSQLVSGSSTTNLAVYHVPLESASAADVASSAYLRDSWGKRIFANNIPFVAAFENHSHLYKRTQPLYEHGTVFFGDGNIGITMVHEEDLRRPSMDNPISKAGIQNHFFSVNISKNSITVNAIDENGAIFDSWTRELGVK